MNYVLLVFGFILLIKGSDIFVEGSSNIAKKLRVPTLIIGLTIVAFGTSAPEAAVSISAAFTGSGGIAIGNVVGSNLFNLLVVVGTCALFKDMQVEKSVIKKEFPFSILAEILLLIMGADIILDNGSANVISRGEGLTLLAFFIIFIYSIISFALQTRENNSSKEEIEEAKKINVLKSIIFVVAGLAIITLGGRLVVNSASDIAYSWGVSKTLIGLTIVALGTSLPELVISIVSLRKGESDLALGNVIGSNIFNVFFILGAATAVSQIELELNMLVDISILIVASIIAYIFAATGKKVNKYEGICMLLIYAAYTFYIINR